MRIYAQVHLYPPQHCAGAEMMLHTMLRALVDRGHQVDVWLTTPTEATEPYTLNGVTVHPRGSGDPTWPKCDVVVSHLQNVKPSAIAARRQVKPFVNIVHNTHLLTKVHINQPTALVVYNSEWMADALGRTATTIVVRPPVLAEEYRTRPGRKVTLVNLNEAKGGGLFWALARAMPDVEFLGVKGGYGTQILHDLPNVEVWEHGGDMRAVYGSSRLVLMPSSYESWGRVGVEALASGIPVLAHPTPGLRESLGHAGIFLHRDKPPAWAQAIRHLLDDEEAWRKASRRAKARSTELDPTEDLNRWCSAIEALARR